MVPHLRESVSLTPASCPIRRLSRSSLRCHKRTASAAAKGSTRPKRRFSVWNPPQCPSDRILPRNGITTFVASLLDLGDGAAQFGRERAELVAAAVAVACFAGPLQAVGGGAETDRTHSLRSALEPVRSRR